MLGRCGKLIKLPSSTRLSFLNQVRNITTKTNVKPLQTARFSSLTKTAVASEETIISQAEDFENSVSAEAPESDSIVEEEIRNSVSAEAPESDSLVEEEELLERRDRIVRPEKPRPIPTHDHYGRPLPKGITGPRNQRDQRHLSILEDIETELRTAGMWTEDPPDFEARYHYQAPSFELWLQCKWLPTARNAALRTRFNIRWQVSQIALRHYNQQGLREEAQGLVKLLWKYDQVQDATDCSRLR